MSTTEIHRPVSELPGWVPPVLRVLRALDAFNRKLAGGVAWLVPAMAILTFAIVVFRYAFNLGWIWLQELVIYLHAAFLMLAMGSCYRADAHVRVDIWFEKFDARRRAQVEFWGVLLLLFPLCLLLLFYGVPYVWSAWLQLEGSAAAGGLPLVFVLKTLIVLMPLGLLIEGAVRLARARLRMLGVDPVAAGLPASESPPASDLANSAEDRS